MGEWENGGDERRTEKERERDAHILMWTTAVENTMLRILIATHKPKDAEEKKTCKDDEACGINSNTISSSLCPPSRVCRHIYSVHVLLLFHLLINAQRLQQTL
jgi:hypothetical protein